MSNDEIKQYCETYLNQEGVQRLYPMLIELRDHIVDKIPTSKFYECCGKEEWGRAWDIGDNQNKELIIKTDFFQTFVKNVKTSPYYISKMREEKLNKIL